MKKIAVLDYGMGNLHSVHKALEHVAGASQKIQVVTTPEALLMADAVVFPGVGAIRDCIQGLKTAEITEALLEASRSKPLLGICVGMQALFDSSAENKGTECLHRLPGSVRFFRESLQNQLGEKLKVPHMGWNQVTQLKAHPIWQGIPQDARFYFVHSYYVSPANSESSIGSTEHGVTFAAAVAEDNLVAVQFHPEKSQHHGLQLLENFLAWDGVRS